jgi:hypothetical protein
MNSGHKLQHQIALCKALDAAGIKPDRHRQAWFASGLAADPATIDHPPDLARIQESVERLRTKSGAELFRPETLPPPASPAALDSSLAPATQPIVLDCRGMGL